jgi:hypothetical protein
MFYPQASKDRDGDYALTSHSSPNTEVARSVASKQSGVVSHLVDLCGCPTMPAETAIHSLMEYLICMLRRSAAVRGRLELMDQAVIRQAKAYG